MPNRIIRDWTDSERIDALTVHAERFFTRLIMKVDDYGRYNANVKFLKSMLFPLKTDVRETDIVRWLAECEKSNLIALYTVALKEYVQIENFNQVLRQKHEKYPGPEKKVCDTSATQMTSIRIASASLKRIEVEVETESETEARKEDFSHEILNSGFVELENFEKEKKISQKKESDFPVYQPPETHHPTFEAVRMCFDQNYGTEEMARRFYDTYAATDWKLKGSKITKFQNLVKSYVENWKLNEKKIRTQPSFEDKTESMNKTSAMAMEFYLAKQNQQ